MEHPYRKPQDPAPPPRDAMLPVLWAVGVLASALAFGAIALGVWDAHQRAPASSAVEPPRAAEPDPPPPQQVDVVHATRAAPVVTDAPALPPGAPRCPRGTYAKVGMMHEWLCCPSGAHCD